MNKTSHKRVIVGNVISNKNDKTITVEVVRSEKHPLYNKNYISSKKYRAHDEKNEANVGDVVKIVECRPLSATKRFRLLEIVSKAQESK